MSIDERSIDERSNSIGEFHDRGHENCRAIYEVEENNPVPKASFIGRVQDAPGCATMIANALSQQSIHEVNVLLEESTKSSSDLLVSFDSLNVSLGDAAYPYLQPPALEALRKAIDERGKTLVVNSAYRTLAQQHLLYRWWRSSRCNFQTVAPPGASYHQAGLAIDIQDADGWLPYLENFGWRWFGPDDYPHFTYVDRECLLSLRINGREFDIRDTATLAFQRLWNRNNPSDQIAEDGDWGPTTEGKLNLSPSHGFEKAPWDKKPRVLRLSTPRLEGSDVEQLQLKLKDEGIELNIDGVFGPGTDKAVKAHQKKQSMAQSGIVTADLFATRISASPTDRKDTLRRGELGASLNLEVEMIAEGRPNRPGTPITVEKITIHNTANPNRGADAKAHSNWVRNTGFYETRSEDEQGNVVAKKNFVSWHYTVDDKRVIKHLPISEKGWHAGRGNSLSLGIEICMHEGIDQPQAFDKAARLTAVLLYDLHLSVEDVVTHKHWTGKHCPTLLLEGQEWKIFLAKITHYLDGAKESLQDNNDEDV